MLPVPTGQASSKGRNISSRGRKPTDTAPQNNRDPEGVEQGNGTRIIGQSVNNEEIPPFPSTNSTEPPPYSPLRPSPPRGPRHVENAPE